MRSEIILPSHSLMASISEQQNISQTSQIMQQQQKITKNIPILYKIIIALCFVIGYTIYRIFYIPFDNSTCIFDKYFEATFNANRGLLVGNVGNAVIGVAQVAIDSWIIFMGTAWYISINQYKFRLVLIHNMRFPIIAGIVYLFRSFFLIIQKLPFDDYIVWHNPGFFSFTVPYDRTRDFFYSGHTSILIIITLELFIIKWYYASLIAFLTLIYMMNVLIITRIHYTIDIIAAIIFTVLIYRLVMNILKYVDYLFSIPYYLVRMAYFKITRKRKLILRPQEEQFAPDTQQIIRANQQIQI